MLPPSTYSRCVILGASVLISADLVACTKSTAVSDVATLTAKVAQLQEKVAYLSDRQQIHDVYLRYMRGFDRNDVDLMQTAFWPDVQINYGFHSITFDGFVAQHLNGHTKFYTHYGHLITNESVDMKGDVAHVEAYVTRFSTDTKGNAEIIMGRYVDRLDRRNGEWRIAMREFIPVFLPADMKSAFDSALTEKVWPHAGCAMGTWDRRDPSYRRPLGVLPTRSTGAACAE